MEQNVLSVSQLNGYIKMLIERDEVLNWVTLRGEISNFKYHTSGHLYFTLKDAESEIAAVMFRSSASRVTFEPKNGMLVTVYGRVSVYEKSGKYQLYVNAMTDDGIGGLYAEYERLKKKLEAEGLFDDRRKRQLPQFPKCVGVITSPTGAAVRDILNITGRRYPAAEILICPALVQGAEAPASLCASLGLLVAYGKCDVIIIGRGGGSAEDLWAFNNEELVRMIAASPVPVISAVGHETDFTLADFAADKRAPTPSAAAELAVPDVTELLSRLDESIARVDDTLGAYFQRGKHMLTERSGKLALLSPDNKIATMREKSERAEKMLERSMTSVTERLRMAFENNVGRLEAMNPLAIMQRGYSAVRGDGGRIVDRASKLSVGDRVELMFSDGYAEAEVSAIRMKNETGDNA